MEVPAIIEKLGLSDYYNNLGDSDRLKVNRYVSKVSADSKFGYFVSMADLAINDENYKFAVKLCEDSYEIDLDDVMEFVIVEKLIVAYIGCKRYEDAKAACEANLKLFENNKDAIVKALNGNLDELHFRNNYIDIVVGIDSNYELAEQMLQKYNQLGILSDEDLAFRRNSLKIHRLQKVFDGVYSFRPKEE